MLTCELLGGRCFHHGVTQTALADGVIHEGAQADRYVFTINLGHYKSSFSVLTTDSLAVLRLEGLKGYHLPDKLGLSAAASSSVKVNTPALLSAEFPAETPEGLALSSVSIGE